MPAFEPSTWAEVEEALASRKTAIQISNPFVANVRAFTDAPERFISSSNESPPIPSQTTTASELLSSDGEDVPPAQDLQRSLARKRPRPPPRIKRNDGQFDDLLGLGRVDVESMSFVRRYSSNPNVDDFSMTPTSVNGKNFSHAPLNPSSEAFDPTIYLNKIHHATTLKDLVRGKRILKTLRERFDAEAEHIRGEKYVSAVLVQAEFEAIKNSVRSESPFASGQDGEETGKLFAEAEHMLKTRYEVVLRREEKLAGLRRTLGVYTRYQWVFGLGTRLRSSVTEGITAIENAVREYLRGLKWLEAQEGANVKVIGNDINDGFQYFLSCLLDQLSTGHFLSHEMSRLVAVLTSVKRADVISEALSKRMSFAVDGLKKSIHVVDAGVILDEQDSSGKTHRDTTQLITRASEAFFEGLSHLWRLGRVLIGQERWQRTIDVQLLQFSDAYAKILRENLKGDFSYASREAVKEISSVRRRAISDLQIPLSCLSPVVEANNEITECFLRSISTSVETNAGRIATHVVQSGTVGTAAAQRLASSLLEAMSQVDNALIGLEEKGPEGTVESTTASHSTSHETEYGTEDTSEGPETGVKLLGRTCAEAPGRFARHVEGLMKENNSDVKLKSLKLAVCCTELLSTVVDKIWVKSGETSVFDRRAVKRYLSGSKVIINEILDTCTGSYVQLVSSPLQQLVGGLVSFPEEELEDSVSRTIPIKIEGISKSANEVALQLALITIETRKGSDSTELVRTILLSLVRDVGSTLIEVLSTDKLIYHRAAQLWVDVSYIQDMITKGAKSDTVGLQDALDAYSRVKVRAVQAVLADGYSFSLADMDVLKENVVATGMRRAHMVLECFRETWELLNGDPGNSTLKTYESKESSDS